VFASGLNKYYAFGVDILDLIFRDFIHWFSSFRWNDGGIYVENNLILVKDNIENFNLRCYCPTFLAFSWSEPLNLFLSYNLSPFSGSQLRKAVVDHVSDSFLETNVPLLVLIEAAKAGDEKGVEEYAGVFADHANKLVEVS